MNVFLRFLRDESGFIPALIAGAGALATKVLGAGAASALGGIAKGAAGALVGSVIDRRNDRKALSDRWSYMQGQGLTNTEIAGIGGIGAPGSSSGSSVLGNQAAAQHQMELQRAYDREQQDLNRAVQMRSQDMGLASTEIAANASLGSSQIAANASMYNSDNQTTLGWLAHNLRRDQYDNIELPESLNNQIINSPDFQRVKIMAGMGVDNMMATTIGQIFGVNPMDPEAMSQISTERMLQIARYVYGVTSGTFGNAAGASIIGESIGNAGRLSFGSNVRQ